LIWAAALTLALVPGISAAETVLTLTGADGDLAFNAADIATARSAPVPGGADLTVTLTDKAGARLAAFTYAHAGRQISLIACGTTVFTPTIIDAIKGGSMTLSSLSAPEAEALAAILTGQSSCDE
jgi:preprotein translocase subunit SecD